jgi:hypothetical protein
MITWLLVPFAVDTLVRLRYTGNTSIYSHLKIYEYLLAFVKRKRKSAMVGIGYYVHLRTWAFHGTTAASSTSTRITAHGRYP